MGRVTDVTQTNCDVREPKVIYGLLLGSLTFRLKVLTKWSLFAGTVLTSFCCVARAFRFQTIIPLILPIIGL